MGMAITLRDSIYRDSQAACPTCQEHVRCCQLRYLQIDGYIHKTELWHPECDTKWEIDIITSEVKILDQ